MNAPNILFIDDDMQLVQALATRCQSLNLHVRTAHNAFTALTMVEEQVPSIICIDVNMPTGNGLNVCETLSGDPKWSSIPLIVLTGRRDKATMRRCDELGAHYIPKGMDTWERIEAHIRELIDLPSADVTAPEALGEAEGNAAMSELVDCVFEMLGADGALEESDGAAASDSWRESPPWILSIEDDRDFSLALKLKLERRGIAVARAFDGMGGVNQAFRTPADAIILDFNLPNGQGDFVLKRLKANAVTKDIPVIVLTGVKDQMLEQRMMSLGAERFLTKPLAFDDLIDELQQFITLNV